MSFSNVAIQKEQPQNIEINKLHRQCTDSAMKASFLAYGIGKYV